MGTKRKASDGPLEPLPNKRTRQSNGSAKPDNKLLKNSIRQPLKEKSKTSNTFNSQTVALKRITRQSSIVAQKAVSKNQPKGNRQNIEKAEPRSLRKSTRMKRSDSVQGAGRRNSITRKQVSSDSGKNSMDSRDNSLESEPPDPPKRKKVAAFKTCKKESTKVNIIQKSANDDKGMQKQKTSRLHYEHISLDSSSCSETSASDCCLVDPPKKKKTPTVKRHESAKRNSNIVKNSTRKGTGQKKKSRVASNVQTKTPKKATDMKLKRDQKQGIICLSSDNENDRDFVTPPKMQKTSAKRSKVALKSPPKKANLGHNSSAVASIDNTKSIPETIMNTSLAASKEEDDSSDSSDWEEVADLDYIKEEKTYQLPKEPIEIILEGSKKKKTKQEFDQQDWFRIMMNRIRKETQLQVHKVHLLCLMGRSVRLSNLASDMILQALSLSVPPADLLTVETWNTQHLTKFGNWFHKEFELIPGVAPEEPELTLMIHIFQTKQSPSKLHLVLVFISICRALGLTTRLIQSLQPVTHKAADLRPKTAKKGVPKPGEVLVIDDDSKSGKSDTAETPVMKEKQPVKEKPQKEKKKKKSSDPKPKNKTRRSFASKVKYSESDDDEESNDFCVDDTTYRSPTSQSKQKVVSKYFGKNQKTSSSDQKGSKDEDLNSWAEVYIPGVKKWITVDCVHNKINCTQHMEKTATRPVRYVVGVHNSTLVKDLTQKYLSDYLLQIKKIRADPEWWEETLMFYKTRTVKDRKIDENENNQMKNLAMDAPMPKTVSAFKNHPLYVLKRHLLKYEALYPNSIVPLGFIKEEPIYARECVHILHTRQNWLKEGLVVRVGEEPYKHVKSVKVKKSRKGEETTAPLFGKWQTEKYIPPDAVNGIVPKNEYGNVELFQPWMLPKGTVHLDLAGLGKIAKKLGIDIAAAMVGWDFHGGGNHPVMEGWVVCKEHKDILDAAWEEDQMIQKQKQLEKKQARALANWRLLVKGLQIRERMKKKFQLQPSSDKPSGSKAEKEGSCEETGEKAPALANFWPRNLDRDHPEISKDGPKLPF